MATKQAKMLKAVTARKAFFKSILFLYLIFPYLFRHCPNDRDITSNSFQSIKTVLKMELKPH